MSDTRTPVYTASTGSDSKPYVNGPGNGLGFDSGTLWPHLRFDSDASAKTAAEVANIAYAQGYAAAQRDMRRSIGFPQ